ncbi:MAG: CPBP family glutamic-type intramembrane protease [Desulfobacteraceae bacterium]
MKNNLDSLYFQEHPFFEKCPHCDAALMEHARYCGQCGNSMNHPAETSPLNGSDMHTQKTPWQLISRAIGLWVVLLSINGVLGLIGHAIDLSSPYYDLGAEILSAFLILAVFSDSGIVITPLIRNWGFKGLGSFIGIIAGLLFMYMFMWLYFKLALSIGIEQISYLSDFKKHHWPLWSAFVLLCLFPGIFEELAFRGFIMTSLEKVGSPREALVIQAAMFSILHMLPTIFISHFVMGMVLGVIRQRSRSLYPGMFFHIAWNAIVLLEEIWI